MKAPRGGKQSVALDKMRERAKKLPRYEEKWVSALTKKDAYLVLEAWRNIIRSGRAVPPLKTATIKRKTSKGYSKPSHPLYGGGDDMAHTYIRSMRVYRQGKGYKIMMPRVRHHESKLTLDALFDIHEHGCIIKKKVGGLIRIPPRPTLAMAYREVLRKKGNKDALLRDAIEEYMTHGTTRKGDKILREAQRLERKYGTAH